MTEERDNKFTPDFEEKIVQALLSDHVFAEQTMEVIEPNFFDLKYCAKLVEVLTKYYSKYTSFPTVSLLETVIKEEVDNKVIQKECLSFINKIQTKPLNGDSQYVKDNSLMFFRTQSVKNALLNDVIPRIQEKNLEEIVPIIQSAINKGTNRDLGLEYHLDQEKRFVDDVYSTVPTGWKLLNEFLNGGWGQGRLATIIAPSGAGKSQFLANVAAQSALQGKTVVLYTLELSDIDQGRRLDANMTGVPINYIPANKDKVLMILKNKMPKTGRIIIKEYPMMTASIQTIKAHLMRLRLKDIVPDIIIIDYGDLLRPSDEKGEKRHGLEAVWQNMKTMAQELKVPVITASQTNRTGANEEVILSTHISEDFSKIMTSDIILTMARNMEQKQTGVGKMYLAKNRQGQDGQIFCYTIDTAKCQIDMFPLTPALNDELKEKIEQINKTTTAASLDEYLKKQNAKKEN